MLPVPIEAWERSSFGRRSFTTAGKPRAGTAAAAAAVRRNARRVGKVFFICIGSFSLADTAYHFGAGM